MIATTIFSSVSMIQDNSTALADTVGELESSLVIKSIFLFPPATFLHLIVLSLFSLIKCETPGYSSSDIHLYLYSALA